MGKKIITKSSKSADKAFISKGVKNVSELPINFASYLSKQGYPSLGALLFPVRNGKVKG